MTETMQLRLALYAIVALSGAIGFVLGWLIATRRRATEAKNV